MKLIVALIAATIALPGAAVADSKDVFGTWTTEAGSARVSIEDCGDGTPCGRVTWIDPASLEPGLTPETAVDRNNEDPDKRDQPIIGLMMLADFEARRRDWRGGTIYDPESGNSYGSRLKKLDDGTLQVKGCVGPICQTQIWTPVETEAEG